MAKINEILKGGRSPFRNEKDPNKVVGEWSPTDETVLLDNDGSTIVGSNPESREITTQHAATNEVIQAESDEAYINSFKNPTDLAAMRTKYSLGEGVMPTVEQITGYAKDKSKEIGNEAYESTETEYRASIDTKPTDLVTNEEVENTTPGRYNMGFGEALSAKLGQNQLDKLSKRNRRKDKSAINRYEGKGLFNKLFRGGQKGDLTPDVVSAYETKYGDKLKDAGIAGLEVGDDNRITGDADQGLNVDTRQQSDLNQLNKGSLRIGGTESPKVTTENVEKVVEGGGKPKITNKPASEEELKKGKKGNVRSNLSGYNPANKNKSGYKMPGFGKRK